MCFNNNNNESIIMYGQIGLYISLLFLLLLKHILIFYKIDRSTNKQYLCDSNFESFSDKTVVFFTSMKDVF